VGIVARPASRLRRETRDGLDASVTVSLLSGVGRDCKPEKRRQVRSALTRRKRRYPWKCLQLEVSIGTAWPDISQMVDNPEVGSSPRIAKSGIKTLVRNNIVHHHIGALQSAGPSATTVL
jgi:hypothetical protein